MGREDDDRRESEMRTPQDSAAFRNRTRRDGGSARVQRSVHEKAGVASSDCSCCVTSAEPEDATARMTRRKLAAQQLQQARAAADARLHHLSLLRRSLRVLRCCCWRARA